MPIHAKLRRSACISLLATVFAVPALAAGDSTQKGPVSVTKGLEVQGRGGGRGAPTTRPLPRPRPGGTWTGGPRPVNPVNGGGGGGTGGGGGGGPYTNKPGVNGGGGSGPYTNKPGVNGGGYGGSYGGSYGGGGYGGGGGQYGGGPYTNKPGVNGGGYGGNYGGGPYTNKPGVNGGGHHGGGSHWGGNHNGLWVGGWNAPGGWNGYVRPNIGYMVGSYWMQPSFYIPNYTVYGWPAPYQGAAWSRYYNDAVMIDGSGRVYDYRYNVDWDRYDYGPVPVYAGGGYGAPDGYYDQGYYDQGYNQNIDPRCRRADSNSDGTVGGAWVGAAGGALAGHSIAKHGDRTEGAIIGGVVGAVVGGAIGNSIDRNEGQIVCPQGYYADGYGQDYVAYEDNVTYGSDYGYGYGQPQYVSGEVVQPTYQPAPPPQGRVEYRDVRVYRPAPPPQPQMVYAPPAYGYGAPSVTTVVIQGAPTVTTTTTYVEEEVTYAKVYKPAKTTWKAKPKPKPKPKVCYCR